MKHGVPSTHVSASPEPLPGEQSSPPSAGHPTSPPSVVDGSVVGIIVVLGSVVDEVVVVDVDVLVELLSLDVASVSSLVVSAPEPIDAGTVVAGVSRPSSTST